MPRLARVGFILACVVGLIVPTTSEAGIIPWTYDAIFGPVGSMHRTAYAPYYTGYSGGYSGAGYLPASYSYGYATNGCSSCQQSSYYASSFGACGCSPCSTCGSPCAGNCATGCAGGCASGACTTNLAPNGTLSPTPDPQNGLRGIENRLEAIEKHLNLAPPREPSGPRPRTYEPDDFNAAPPRTRPRTNEGLGEGTTIPPREHSGTGTTPRRSGTGTVVDDPETFTEPNIRTRPHGTTTEPDNGMFERNSAPRGGTDSGAPGAGASGSLDTFKPTTQGAEEPKPADADLVIPEKKPAPTGPAVEENNGPQTLRLDSRLTSRAVSPRERQTIVIGNSKPTIARTNKAAPHAKNWAGTPRTTDLAQHR